MSGLAQATVAPILPSRDLALVMQFLRDLDRTKALTGTPPFSGSLQTILNAHVAKPPPKVTSRTDRFPVAIDAVTGAGWMYKPKKA